MNPVDKARVELETALTEHKTAKERCNAVILNSTFPNDWWAQNSERRNAKFKMDIAEEAVILATKNLEDALSVQVKVKYVVHNLRLKQ